jgi:monoamine oxidase
LTLAYRLSKAGRRATIYEASPRLGGRMFTKRNFNDEGMFCELGGELVDTNHKPLIDLAQELGVSLQRVKTDPAAEDIYFIDSRLHTEREMLRKGGGAFRAIAEAVARDKAAVLDANGEWTDRGRALDGMSLKAYLTQFRGHAPDWVIDLVDLAYWGEYGVPTNEQSALNLVDLIGADPSGDFAMFGASDEVFRIAGGSSALPDALAAKLGTTIGMKTQCALTSIADTGANLRLGFNAAEGPMTVNHATVVLALPFTKLRQVQGIDALGLSAQKLKAIRELGYGDNAKVMIGTTSRPWTGAADLPAKSDGEFYAKAFQVVWDTSRGQPGTRGILTNYLTGVEDKVQAVTKVVLGLQSISRAIADSVDPENVAAMFWARNPHALGSFSAAKVGQYTTLLEACAPPELGGRLQFAGEHTSADYAGFMCGGVDSGERVAKALLGDASAKKAA